mmetsp:Transcript_5658/g.16637  ORF Transcript_5658/g.16637 Transcript_5658/m.16637 type:complete len:239 (-) Transcript_5658:489-1205(-)
MGITRSTHTSCSGYANRKSQAWSSRAFTASPASVALESFCGARGRIPWPGFRGGFGPRGLSFFGTRGRGSRLGFCGGLAFGLSLVTTLSKSSCHSGCSGPRSGSINSRPWYLTSGWAPFSMIFSWPPSFMRCTIRLTVRWLTFPWKLCSASRASMIFITSLLSMMRNCASLVSTASPRHFSCSVASGEASCSKPTEVPSSTLGPCSSAATLEAASANMSLALARRFRASVRPTRFGKK